jgi:hypothetical protein
MDLNEKHRAEREALQQRYMQQINSLKKQLENEEARLRSRHSEELRRQQKMDFSPSKP